MREQKIMDATERFEKALKSTAKETYILRLYITGITPNSMRAIENIKRFCEDHLQGRFELEVIDIYKRPELAREAQIVAAPTLVKLLPVPLRRFVGDLSDEKKILVGLDLLPKQGNA